MKRIIEWLFGAKTEKSEYYLTFRCPNSWYVEYRGYGSIGIAYSEEEEAKKIVEAHKRPVPKL